MEASLHTSHGRIRRSITSARMYQPQARHRIQLAWPYEWRCPQVVSVFIVIGAAFVPIGYACLKASQSV